MKKLSLPLSILAILASILSFFYFNTKSDLVYVDVNKLLDGYKRTKVEREKLNVKISSMKANVDSLLTNWQTELKNYEKERASMTKKEINLKQELLSNKQEQINGYQQAVQKQMQEEDQKVTQTVINDINDFVKEFGKKEGYDIIFGASGNGNIMYAGKGSDLTATVLEGLNKEYEGK